jgi:hypothetical protein
MPQCDSAKTARYGYMQVTTNRVVEKETTSSLREARYYKAGLQKRIETREDDSCRDDEQKKHVEQPKHQSTRPLLPLATFDKDLPLRQIKPRQSR